MVSFDFRARIAAFRRRLEKGSDALGVSALRMLGAKRERLERFTLQLEERSPLRVLERGYAIATDAAGNLLRSSDQVGIGDTVAIRLRRGRLTTEVKEKE